MRYQSVLVLSPSVAVATPLSGQTGMELLQYVMGVYENLFKLGPPVYKDGKAAFLCDVLVHGYLGCEQVQGWNGVPEVVHVDLEELEPTPVNRLDHHSFEDAHAHVRMVNHFAATL